jgi:uncharacterized metal-binding protein
MAESVGCTCGSAKVRVLFACSGAADTGEISDRVARRLARGGGGRMACLSGVGGRVPYVMDSLQQVGEVWAIDGCSEDCARHTLEGAGFTVARHLRVTDCGLEKGKSPASEENVTRVLGQAQAAS